MKYFCDFIFQNAYILVVILMYNIGDLVTRKSYDNDIVFKIIDIIEDNYILKGISIRLYADSYEEDLKLVSGEVKSDFNPEITEYRTLDRNEYFYLPGKVLHIDSDSKLSNTLTNPYKIREKQKFKNIKITKKRIK